MENIPDYPDFVIEHINSVISDDVVVLAEDDINKYIRNFSFKQTEDIVETCPISLNEFKDGDMVCEIIKCKHKFSHEGFMRWIDSGKNTCPVCRCQIMDSVKIKPINVEYDMSYVIRGLIGGFAYAN
jgi:hypothetical protein